MKKLLKEIVALLLCILVIVTTNVSIVTYNQVEAKENTIKEYTKSVIMEIKEQRTENSSTYLLSDGTKRVDISNEAFRYFDNGRLIEYDSSLIELNSEDKRMLEAINKNEEEYIAVNAKGNTKQYFPKKLNKNNEIIMNMFLHLCLL